MNFKDNESSEHHSFNETGACSDERDDFCKLLVALVFIGAEWSTGIEAVFDGSSEVETSTGKDALGRPATKPFLPGFASSQVGVEVSETICKEMLERGAHFLFDFKEPFFCIALVIFGEHGMVEFDFFFLNTLHAEDFS